MLVLSPHCDDIPLALGGTLLSHPLKPTVLVVFSRCVYTLSSPYSGNVDKVTALREREERLAAKQFGYSVIFAGLKSALLRKPGEAFTADIDCLEEAAEVVSQYAEDLVIGPAGAGNHLDHRILRKVMDNLPGKKILYEDQPYTAYAKDVRSNNLFPWLIRGNKAEEKKSLLKTYKSQLTSRDRKIVSEYYERLGGERIWTYEDEQPFTFCERL